MQIDCTTQMCILYINLYIYPLANCLFPSCIIYLLLVGKMFTRSITCDCGGHSIIAQVFTYCSVICQMRSPTLPPAMVHFDPTPCMLSSLHACALYRLPKATTLIILQFGIKNVNNGPFENVFPIGK